MTTRKVNASRLQTREKIRSIQQRDQWLVDVGGIIFHLMADHCTLDPFSDVLLASLTLDLRWSVISLTPQAVPITVAYYFYGHRSPRSLSLTKSCNKQTTDTIFLTLLLRVFSTTSTQSTYTIPKILLTVKMVLWLYGVLQFSVKS